MGTEDSTCLSASPHSTRAILQQGGLEALPQILFQSISTKKVVILPIHSRCKFVVCYCWLSAAQIIIYVLVWREERTRWITSGNRSLITGGCHVVSRRDHGIVCIGDGDA